MEAPKLGRYTIQSELGRGAMGVVYKAADSMLERTVAIKTVNMNLTPEEAKGYEARFYQEARAAGGLNHPNIVTIYDVGKRNDVVYMAMEFLEGDELRSLIAEGRPLPVTQAISHRGAGRRRPGLRARARHRAPRHQAGQHHGDAERPGEDHRLRHRAHARRVARADADRA